MRTMLAPTIKESHCAVVRMRKFRVSKKVKSAKLLPCVVCVLVVFFLSSRRGIG